MRIETETKTRKGHVWEDCKVRIGGHPDANPHSHIPWAKSEKGEAWANNPEHPKKTLPTTWTLSGEKLNREGKASRTIVLPLGESQKAFSLEPIPYYVHILPWCAAGEEHFWPTA